jgi:predicted  nucleic acid-binding Zn-ribbon protein
MSRLRVPAYMKRAKTEFEIKESSVRAFEDMYGEFLNLRLRIQTLENEVLAYQNPDYAHPPIKAKLQEFQTQNNDLAMRFVKEQNRADILESEIQRLTDHILAQPAEGELDSLKREYNVLSQKCDNLVSRNIELSNRMKELGRSKQLEDILDGIRDKINSALRAGIHEAPDAILKSLSDEISQLKRARLYLGRALYDIGILYHRKGDRERAKEELRAARELGVRDADVENILKQN